jgi:DNA-binding GntR family transcriptional regulator
VVDSSPARRAREIPTSAGALGSEMYARILSQLMSVTIEPGARLTVDALAREMEVSQTPIREALGRLEADGLVVKSHLRGYRATPVLSPREFDELFEIRALLEPFAASRAAELRTEEQLAALEELDRLMAEFRVDSRPSRPRSAFSALDAEFHDLVAQAGANSLVRDSLARLHSHMHIFRLRRDQTVVDTAVEEHHPLVVAIRDRNAHVAKAAMRFHVERSHQRVRNRFEST